ncbi:hypothetical protein [Veronia pacifica]|uniref:Uncharacterized protein n=1 Tax=Veronia pacifica TaxID=1080227 RepID=A0A1C3ER05_9GAMM|nr:hypothetical protein [Veronia pacifica]ODA35662.1 hypothetical protein A8L45_03345 [Veronia pacifica]
MDQINHQFDALYSEWKGRPERELSFHCDDVKVNLKKLERSILIESTLPDRWIKGRYDLDKVLYYTLISAEHYPAAPAIKEEDSSLWLTLLVDEFAEPKDVVSLIEKVVNQVDTWNYLISYDE